MKVLKEFFPTGFVDGRERPLESPDGLGSVGRGRCAEESCAKGGGRVVLDIAPVDITALGRSGECDVEKAEVLFSAFDFGPL